MENIVIKLIEQHRILQKDLGGVMNLSNNGESVVPEIISSLGVFTETLLDHLNIENTEFYPSLLKKMEEKGMDTNDTKKFINEMKGIEITVKTFLGKYADKNSYVGLMDVFKKDLTDIIVALNLRIESEEAGVFTVWSIFQNA